MAVPRKCQKIIVNLCVLVQNIRKRIKNMMKFEEYLDHFDSILNSKNPEAPYDNPEYFQFAKLNWSRTQRWLKKGVVLPEVAEKIKAINTPQHWIVITEPWCGDAAQCVPFFQL